MEKLTRKQAFALAMDAYKGISSDDNYTAEERKDGMRKYLSDLAKDYRRNKIEIFEIIETVIGDVLPQRIETALSFAEVKVTAEGDIPKFTVKNGKIKAFTVALGGTVRRQRRDRQTITVETEGIQTKVYEELGRIRAGLVDFAELIDDALDALEEEYMSKIYTALTGTYANLPATNKHQAASMVEAEFDKLIKVVASYGEPVIYGTSAALATLATAGGVEDLADKRNQGYVLRYKGRRVVELPNSTVDDTNAAFQLTDRYIYIIPEGKEKIVKVGIEGDAYVRESDGEDWTQNFEIMQQSGVAVLQLNYFATYDNTALA